MPDPPAAGHRLKAKLRALFRGGTSAPSSPSGPARPAPLAARISCRSQVLQTRYPSGEIGPEPVDYPVTGCSILVELAAPGVDTVVITSIGAEVTDVTEVEFDSVSVSQQRMPDLIGSDDLVEPTRRAVEGYRPLDPPHFEALLDHRPPIVERAHGSAQQPMAMPLILRPGETAFFFVAPVTSDVRLTSWNLFLHWTLGQYSDIIRWPLTVTGDTGHKIFYPHEHKASEPAPIQTLAPDHWTPRRPKPDDQPP